MYQHKIFTENTEIFDTFRDKIHSCLRVPRKCLQGLLLNMGENVFFRGFVTAVTELYDAERQKILNPDDIVKTKLNRNKICSDISERINACFDSTLNLLCSNAYFDYRCNIEYFV